MDEKTQVLIVEDEKRIARFLQMELEHEGFIYSMTGKGSFVSPIQEVDAGRRAAKTEQFREAAQELLRLGAQKETLIAMLEELEQEDSHA